MFSLLYSVYNENDQETSFIAQVNPFHTKLVKKLSFDVIPPDPPGMKGLIKYKQTTIDRYFKNSLLCTAYKHNHKRTISWDIFYLWLKIWTSFVNECLAVVMIWGNNNNHNYCVYNYIKMCVKYQLSSLWQLLRFGCKEELFPLWILRFYKKFCSNPIQIWLFFPSTK